MELTEFENLVFEVLEGLPRQFQEKLDNVTVVVEDWPVEEQLKSVKLSPGTTLFGLYQGVPKTRRGSSYTLVPPDKITIFQGPLEYFFRMPEAIKEQVRKTVMHEIGHHFGLSDADISAKEQLKNQKY